MKNDWNDWKYYLYRKAWRFAGPPHEEHKLNKEAYGNLLRMGGLMVRNTYNFDCQEETCFWYVIKDSIVDIEGLKPRVRNKIKHAQKAFVYRQIDLSFLKEKGYPILSDVFEGYASTDRNMNEAMFSDYISDTSFNYWGVFDKTTSELIGFCCVKLWDNCCEYDLSGIMTRYKHNATYPYYGLYYTMNQHYLKTLHFKYVSDGSRSITEHSHIHDFLIQNFNFRKAYCQLEVHYNWWMKIAVTLLYPFRKIIPLKSVKAVLNMEAMQRGEK